MSIQYLLAEIIRKIHQCGRSGSLVQLNTDIAELVTRAVGKGGYTSEEAAIIDGMVFGAMKYAVQNQLDTYLDERQLKLLLEAVEEALSPVPVFGDATDKVPYAQRCLEQIEAIESAKPKGSR